MVINSASNRRITLGADRCDPAEEVTWNSGRYTNLLIFGRAGLGKSTAAILIARDSARYGTAVTLVDAHREHLDLEDSAIKVLATDPWSEEGLPYLAGVVSDLRLEVSRRLRASGMTETTEPIMLIVEELDVYLDGDHCWDYFDGLRSLIDDLHFILSKGPETSINVIAPVCDPMRLPVRLRKLFTSSIWLGDLCDWPAFSTVFMVPRGERIHYERRSNIGAGWFRQGTEAMMEVQMPVIDKTQEQPDYIYGAPLGTEEERQAREDIEYFMRIEETKK